jgi:hypothetical protein
VPAMTYLHRRKGSPRLHGICERTATPGRYSGVPIAEAATDDGRSDCELVYVVETLPQTGRLLSVHRLRYCRGDIRPEAGYINE